MINEKVYRVKEAATGGSYGMGEFVKEAHLLNKEFGFRSHMNPGFVVFPVFDTDIGSTKTDINFEYWKASNVSLRFDARLKAGDLAKWITYEEVNEHVFKPITFLEFIQKGYRGRKVQLKSWR